MTATCSSSTRCPPGTYLHVAYHPSGLALAFVVETDEGQEIWLSTNEGEDPQRLIFSKRGTTFTSLVFSPNGERLWWTAEHAEGYPELHFMNLDTRTGFGTAWRGTEGTVAGGLKLAPAGPLAAVTEGADCEEHEALVLSNGSTTVALPDETRPTEALGWLDRRTLLVGAGGCGDTIDLYTVDARGEDDPAVLALEVEMAAPRTRVAEPARRGARSPTRRGTASRRRRLIALSRATGRSPKGERRRASAHAERSSAACSWAMGRGPDPEEAAELLGVRPREADGRHGTVDTQIEIGRDLPGR